MAKPVYCSECGKKLPVTIKAVKGYGRIISLIDPHECTEEPIPLDLTPTEIPSEYGGERQFSTSLDNQPEPFNSSRGAVSTKTLEDRRLPEHLKSTAPMSILERMKDNIGTQPEGDISKEPEGE